MPSMYDTLKEKLTPALLTSVVDALGDEFNFDLIPRSRLNKVIAQRNALQDQIAAGAHSNNESTDEDDDVPPATTAAKPATAGKTKDANKGSESIEEIKRQFEVEKLQAIQEVKLQFAGLDKLRSAGSVDPELAFSLIDKSKLKVTDSGDIEGLDDQLTALKESKAYLFGSSSATGGRKAAETGTGKGQGTDDAAFETQLDAQLNQIFMSSGVLPENLKD